MNSAAVSQETAEIVVSRLFDAPRELVFEAWTNPQHVPHWFGPNRFNTTIHEMDVRPGGVWRLTMHGPDGRDYRNHIVFLEVVKPARLVYKHEPEPGSEPVSFQTTVTFAAEGCQTRLTLRMLFPSSEAREHAVRTYHADEGGIQTLGRLAAHLPQMAVKDLLLTRVFDAPRELVFRAWTERDRLQRWWRPKGFTNPVCEVDVRPGGAIRIEMVGPGGWACPPMVGVFLEAVAPERLVFTTVLLDANGKALFEVLNVVTFEDIGGKTRLTLRAIVTKTTETAQQYLAGMDQGWSESLDRLALEAAAI
jgi:uncharacterized protein YndB with AHSA1/START domain